MLAAHGSAKKALKFAFPDLRFLFKCASPALLYASLTRSLSFPVKPSSKEPTPSRAFFDNYARDANFDPLITTNWYSLPLTNLASTKVHFSSCSTRRLTPTIHRAGRREDRVAWRVSGGFDCCISRTAVQLGRRVYAERRQAKK